MNNIEIFNPKLAELQELNAKYKDLKITDINDETGYQLLKKADSELVHARTDINKIGKAERDASNAYSKAVIALEKRALEITADTEKSIKEQIANIDLQKERNLRLAELPDRRKRMIDVESEDLTDDQLLDMNYQQFTNFILDAQQKKLDRQAEKQRKDQEEIDKANKKIEDDKKLAEASKIAADNERQRILDQQKKDEDDRIKKEKDDKERLEKDEKYQQFLKDNGVTSENIDNFKIIKTTVLEKTFVIIYSKIAEIEL